MLSRITEHFDHQIRGSIHHQMLFLEIWRRCDIANESNDRGHFVEVSNCRLYLRQDVQATKLRSSLSLFHVDILAQNSNERAFAVLARYLAGYVENIAGSLE